MATRVLFGALVAVIAVGCGGERPPELYVLGATRACLAQEELRLRNPTSDFVASTALGGAVNARFPRRVNEVTLAFGESETDAERIVQAYTRFAPRRLRRRLPDVLHREKNVVLLWGVAPTEDQSQTVRGCLRGAE